MSQTLTVSDLLYTRLEAITRQRGLNSIEQLLETWQKMDDELRLRQRAVQEVDRVREHLFATYGEMPDSVELLREDRAR